MEALQYIYTSWKNGDSSEKGYMIYSRSEGISELECNAIKAAMQYLAPKGLTLTPTPEEIADIFPYAFSYFVLPTGRGCVAQSTYLGKDYSGRYGNYIIYALVFDINDLPCRPAEFFAEPYIKTVMTQEELDAPSPVPPLPPLHISEYASIINDDQLNEFLMDKEDEFAQLISMMLAAQDLGIPFYLNDIRENLVLWSAAIQRILPRKLANKFMFNTYIGDHQSMLLPRVKEMGLKFHLIGVRPDANYFNYSTECRSNSHIVMDFIGGYMTEGVIPSSYAQAMASSIAFDCEDVDFFGDFIETTSFDSINGQLQDAYIYYSLLKNDEFEFTEDNLKAILSFGSAYCSESDNSDIGSKLLVKCQEEGWTLEPELLELFWRFVCKYAGFMMFTLFELFTETIYQHAGEASAPCDKLISLMQKIRNETPQQYRGYVDYFNSVNSVEHMLMYLTGHNNLFTNSFYVNWLLQSYPFSGGLNNGQPVSRLLQTLLNNLSVISGSEKQTIEILLKTSVNQELFENTISIFMATLTNPGQLEKLCDSYVEVTESLSEGQLNRFEQLLLDTPKAALIATRLCVRKIALAKNPENEFWRFYENQRPRILTNSSLAIEPMILACINNVDSKDREDVAINILRKIDSYYINDRETVKALTDVVDRCSVKALSKMESSFLKKVAQIRTKVDEIGMDKVKAVYVGQMMITKNAQYGRFTSLSGELEQAGVSLKSFERSDYEAYIKNYFGEYLALIQTKEDIPVLMKTFYNDRYFQNYIDDYISVIKKMEKKEAEKWKRIIGWTCVYIVTAERSDKAADELYKPIVRYLRSLDEDELLDVRQIVIQDVPSSRCDYLFDEVRRKEGLSEKLSGFFHKK